MNADPKSGALIVRVGDAVWRQQGPARNMRRLSVDAHPGRRLEYDVTVPTIDGREITILVRVTLARTEPALTFEIDVADRNADVSRFAFPAPFAPAGRRSFLLMQSVIPGQVLPCEDSSWLSHGPPAFVPLDMPWVGLTDMQRGYICIVETPDDCFMRLSEYESNGQKIILPEPVWLSARGQFRYPRKVTYHFVADGDYVALAKRFREYAEERGWVRTMREKRRLNPKISLLMGAPHIWGATVELCREAKRRGVRRAVVSGDFTAEEVREIADMGYLVAQWCDYVDVQEGDSVGLMQAPLSDCLVGPDGRFAREWKRLRRAGTWYKRCSALASGAAEALVRSALSTHPYNAAFCEAMASEQLIECHHPDHAQTRSEDRASRTAFLKAMRSFGLVVGGPRARPWAVPFTDYQTQMMSGGVPPWAQLHAQSMTNRVEVPERYVQQCMGHQRRAPLWELVFHDCIVGTWHRRDGNGYLYDVMPDISDKKDAFNVLYGTPPLMWAGGPGYGWDRHPERFMQTYRNTCKWHERVGWEEMLSHEFLDRSHSLQRTTFSGGYTAVVNFGDEPQTVEVGASRYTLGQNGFVASGPDFLEYHIARPEHGHVTYICGPDYLYADPGSRPNDFGPIETSVPTTVHRTGAERLRVDLEGPGWCVLEPEALSARWDPNTTRIFRLDRRGDRVEERPRLPQRAGGGRAGRAESPTIELTSLDSASFEVAWGNAARGVDLAVELDGVRFVRDSDGLALRVEVAVANLGSLPAAEAVIALYVDREERGARVAQMRVFLAPGETRRIGFEAPTERLRGRHAIIVVADPEGRINELIESNNRASREILVGSNHLK
ncbi:MAG: glycoside hydrolase [Armatimonadota bacterium]